MQREYVEGKVQTKVEELMAANTVNPTVTECPHCGGVGSVVDGLKPGFVCVADSVFPAFQRLLDHHGYYSIPMPHYSISQIGRTWYEIGPVFQREEC